LDYPESGYCLSCGLSFEVLLQRKRAVTFRGPIQGQALILSLSAAEDE